MNTIVNMENVLPETQPNTSEQIMDKIQNIILCDKSKVSEETIGTQDIVDDSITTEDPIEDENENTLNIAQRSETFYKDAQSYWKSVPATIDGMLGGFSNISFTDIRGSQDFLKELFKSKPSPNKNVALDCGAGTDY